MSFTNDLQELIYAWPGYKRTCVICRPDGIPVGPDVSFVELNCDSPAMMDLVAQCLLQLDGFASVRGQVKPMSAADKLLGCLLDCYREYRGAPVHPTIAQQFLEVPRMELPFVDGKSLLINITLGGGLMPTLVKS